MPSVSNLDEVKSLQINTIKLTQKPHSQRMQNLSRRTRKPSQQLSLMLPTPTPHRLTRHPSRPSQIRFINRFLHNNKIMSVRIFCKDTTFQQHAVGFLPLRPQIPIPNQQLLTSNSSLLTKKTPTHSVYQPSSNPQATLKQANLQRENAKTPTHSVCFC